MLTVFRIKIDAFKIETLSLIIFAILQNFSLLGTYISSSLEYSLLLSTCHLRDSSQINFGDLTGTGSF